MVVRHTTRTASEANPSGALPSEGFAHPHREAASIVPQVAANCCGRPQAGGRQRTSSHGGPVRVEERVGASGFPPASAGLRVL
jgi:hypothetical protein